MRLSYILPLFGVVALTFTACKKNEKTETSAKIATTDSVKMHTVIAVSPYPFADTFVGNLRAYLKFDEPYSVYRDSDAAYRFYVVYLSEDSIVFVNSRPIHTSMGSNRKDFYDVFKVNSSGLYTRQLDTFAVSGNNLHIFWSEQLSGGRTTSESSVYSYGWYSGTVIKRNR